MPLLGTYRRLGSSVTVLRRETTIGHFLLISLKILFYFSFYVIFDFAFSSSRCATSYVPVTDLTLLMLNDEGFAFNLKWKAFK